MKYYIGIDGGGSKTCFCVQSADKTFQAQINSGRSNPVDVGSGECVSVLKNGCERLCSENGIDPGDVTGIFAGIAGAASGNYKEIIKNGLLDCFINARAEANHDAINVLYAAFPDRDGAAVICGTGSSCFVKKGVKIHRIGGYGLFDLRGNGFETGKAAIGYALTTVDGRARESVLSRLVKEKAGFDLVENLGALISAKKSDIAAYAPLVYDAYKKGDASAENILKEQLSHIAGLINAAGRFFDGVYPVSVAGSMGSDPLTLEIIGPALDKRAEVGVLGVPPVYGALNYAKLL